MAAVTLKDLMDPLKKIEAAANETNEKLDALIAVSTGGNDGGGSMAIISELQTQTLLLQQIAASSADEAEYSSRNLSNFIFTRLHRKKLLSALKEKNEEDATGGGAPAGGGGGKLADLKALGIGSIKTAMGMILWAVVPKKGVEKFANFIVKGEVTSKANTKLVQFP